MAAKKKKRKLSRRGFLILLGVGGAGLVVGVQFGVPFARRKIAEFIEGSDGSFGGVEGEPTAWFEITPDNIVRVYLPKVEMGQGVHTALAQIAAEELEVPWEQIEVRQAGTGQGLDDSMGTSGSTSVAGLYQPIREAAASMRVMILAEASRILDRPVERLRAEDGQVVDLDDDSRAMAYGEVVVEVEEWTLPDEVPPLKPVGEFKVVGQSKPRVDIRAKVTGEAVYGYDMRLPGMLYGAVARPPRTWAELLSAGPGKAAGMPGVVQVVVEDGFAGVVAETNYQARQAVQQLELEWGGGLNYQQEDIERMVTVGEGREVTIQKEGNPNRVLEELETISASYRTPMAFHAHLEAQAAVVDARPDGVDVWVSTQSPVRMRGFVAKVLGRKEEEVTVMPAYLGGGFGRKVGAEVVVEAARLSGAVGKPVHVGWTREEDFLYGYLRPPTHSELRGAANAEGKILAMEHRQASGEVSFPFFPGIAKAVLGADFGSWRGAMIPYDVQDKQTVTYLAALPVSTGWWRGLGLLPNVFATESFMDELAVSVGVDPLEFRLRNLPDTDLGERMRQALEAAAKLSGWNKPAPEGVGRGVAMGTDAGTVVAEVAEVVMDGSDFRVQKVYAVVDPGLVISPDGAKAQIEGAITMGLSSVLKEAATVKDGLPGQSNFGAYPLLTMREAPELEIQLLQGDDRPHGLGEPPIAPIGAAVANALYDLTGQRIRTLPIRL